MNLDQFGHDPWWLVLIKVVAVFAFLVVMTLFAIWYERRVVARMQVRPGPNRVAISSAAARFAPVDGPEKMPSSRAAWRAVANALASGMAMTSS